MPACVRASVCGDRAELSESTHPHPHTRQSRAERNLSRGEYSAAIDECQAGKELLASCSKERHKDEWYIEFMDRFDRCWPRVDLSGSVRERVGATARGDEKFGL